MSARELISQAEHARRCAVSRKSVTVWKDRGQLVLVDGLVDFESSYKGERWHASTKKAHAEAGQSGTARPRSAPKGGRTAASRAPAPTVRTMTRAAALSRLQALDWTQPFNTDAAALRSRLHGAATAVGLAATESALQDDGHWGGWQLRNLELQRQHGGLCFEAVAAGFGFELDEAEVLFECRQRIHHPDDSVDDMQEPIGVRLDLLPLLAYPFHDRHRPPSKPSNPENLR